MDDKKNKKVADFKPSQEFDPKRPTLTLDESIDLDEDKTNYTKTYDRFDLNNDTETNNSPIKTNEEDQTQNQNLENNKNDAKSIIARLKRQLEEKEQRDEQLEKGGKVVMPDPNSENRLYGRPKANFEDYTKVFKDPKTKLRDASRHARDNFTQEEIDKIVETFTYKVVKVTKKEVVLKYSKYGFEFFKNNSDGRYWVSTLIFEEVWNPRKYSYITYWNGNTFIGYGNKTLDECIQKAKDLTVSTRTGDVVWKDFVIDWNQKNNRFIVGDTPKKFTWDEYRKIVKWWDENKIWILVKQEKVRDIEDLMNETREKKAKGERVSPLASIQAKLLDPPRRAQGVHGYPVQDPKYKGKDYIKPENKLYEIGFTYVE
ncbi:hypothetical protein [Spiroplasma tabanidicola]|uniref:Uncharacterized protein n=1 Tax=Spiroplasma tabanidicola TaxID=324079 RepID=A0A6I6CDH4_9MOLU|nr:hypothetical protein [Spiroplasma tabanidicola]QGS52172.1 hypothetical protein STABA_v1c08160 [Spiroplasma tabanidicola]